MAVTLAIPPVDFRTAPRRTPVRRSGESFRPREAAGFGGWLEQSRYAILHAGAVRQIGFDEEQDAEDAEPRLTARPRSTRHDRRIGSAVANSALDDPSFLMGTASGIPLPGKAVPLKHQPSSQRWLAG